jgi:cell division protein FtsI (penicillin-binding protein 3)
MPKNVNRVARRKSNKQASETRRRRPLARSAGKILTTPEAMETGRTRLLVVGSVLLLGFCSVGARLVDLTLLQAAEEPKLARATSTRQPVVQRADILDRNGTVVATSLATASMFANPRRVLNPDEAARQIASVLPDIDTDNLVARLSQDRGFIWLRRNLTPRQQSAVHKLGIPGIDFQREERRVYPHGSLMAHLLGYAKLDNRGLAGVEQSFDERLRGRDKPLQLSIDSRVQHIVRAALAETMARHKAIGAAGIVLDIQSGELLAMVSLPDFDPNDVDSVEASHFNRASLGVYELGSAFKIFTTAMALDSGVVSMMGGYDATQPIKVSRFTIRDYHAKRRWLSVPEIFIYSSNIGSAKMALDVGATTQQTYLRRLGLLNPSPIELAEVGDPKSPAVWRPVNTMTIAFGHGIAISPLQLTSAVAAVLNGGIYRRPTLLKYAPGEVPDDGRRVISERTSRQMRKLLRMVVEDGTGRKAAVKGYNVGGKTGTAEKQSAGRYKRKALISSFVGAFPMDAPRYVVLALFDEPRGIKETHGYATGGWVAAPAVGRIIARIAPALGMRPADENEPAPENDLATVIKVEGKKLASF